MEELLFAALAVGLFAYATGFEPKHKPRYNENDFRSDQWRVSGPQGKHKVLHNAGYSNEKYRMEMSRITFGKPNMKP